MGEWKSELATEVDREKYGEWNRQSWRAENSEKIRGEQWFWKARSSDRVSQKSFLTLP